MNQDEQHLRLLSIFHYVVSGLCALFSLFPTLYMVMGGFFVYAARHYPPKPGQEPPPEFMGWIFIAIGSLLFLAGLTLAVSILLAGRTISQRKRYWLAFVVACVECLFMPFGTVLGVFTIIVLSRESVKQLFTPRPP
jgi:hypothetical protein